MQDDQQKRSWIEAAKQYSPTWFEFGILFSGTSIALLLLFELVFGGYADQIHLAHEEIRGLRSEVKAAREDIAEIKLILARQGIDVSPAQEAGYLVERMR